MSTAPKHYIAPEEYLPMGLSFILAELCLADVYEDIRLRESA